jgi:hypothetical protein
MALDHEPQQEALFEIEGFNEDGCVWICSANGRNDWCRNLGPAHKVVEVLSQWLASIDNGESGFLPKENPDDRETHNPLPDNYSVPEQPPYIDGDENDLRR